MKSHRHHHMNVYEYHTYINTLHTLVYDIWANEPGKVIIKFIASIKQKPVPHSYNKQITMFPFSF